MKIEGCVFIVTGGASGLGESVVRSLIAQGAFVSIFDISKELANKIVEELGEEKCYYHGKTDVSNESDVDLAIAKTLEHFPQYPLAGAILCSGILKAPNHVSGYGPDNVLTSYRQFEHIIKVNLLGTYCVAQKVSEVLLKNEPMNQDGERGIIITVSSILGLDGTLVSYGTSKAGIAGLTLPLARELASFGIRIMSIAPGPFDTPIVKRSDVPEAPKSLFPNRYGKPNEFAALVSEIIKMSMFNGSVIRLDGALRSF